jgi:peroxiredoxin
MNPADLQVNIDQRQELVDTADYAGFVKPGDRVPDFTLDEVGGETLTRDGLLAGGPAVLVFFRFAGCPACNIALPYYQRQLWPGLAALGVPLIAVSPQVPEKLIEIKARHDLPFLVATDPGNALARHFGILYSANAASRTLAAAKGYEIGEITGTGTWELPMPTVVVIDRDGIVRFADVAPDWLKRTETEPVLDAVRGLAIAAAA